MLASQLFAPTLKETPAEAEIISHQLLLRAGFIRKSAAGVYIFLPLAWRVIKKIEQIVREEMDRYGGQELMLPIIQPAEVWQDSGRWEVYGPELFRLKDRNGRDFCLGPTHEEIITTLIQREITSYRQLPLLLYQIQNKYRDERRPRFGLLRGREFIMKDLYSFDLDDKGLEKNYQKMYQAYSRIFKRCGLNIKVVEADAGAIGGKDTHEFMALAEVGEAVILFCENCNYAANVEKVAATFPLVGKQNEPLKPLQPVDTPDQHTVEQVTKALGVSPERIIKTLIFLTEKGPVASLVRGDREVNEVKLQKTLGSFRLELASPEEIKKLTGARVGFSGPVGLKGAMLIADLEVPGIINGVSGANQDNTHFINVNSGRDFIPDLIEDIRMVGRGEPCPRCRDKLQQAKGIEVGQIFKLGDKYSKILEANYVDVNGLSHPIVMGCYGIGISRTMAAAVEQNHDQNGIIWPVNIAPFHLVVVPVSDKDDALVSLAEKVYHDLLAAGVETVLDDRSERAGVKFKDADLIGYPLRITIGSKAVAEKKVEIRLRKTGETIMAPVEGAVNKVKEILQEL